MSPTRQWQHTNSLLFVCFLLVCLLLVCFLLVHLLPAVDIKASEQRHLYPSLSPTGAAEHSYHSPDKTLSFSFTHTYFYFDVHTHIRAHTTEWGSKVNHVFSSVAPPSLLSVLLLPNSCVYVCVKLCAHERTFVCGRWNIFPSPLVDILALFSPHFM